MEWPIRESLVQNYGSFGLEQRRIRIGSCGEGGNRRNGVAIDSERLLSVWSCGNQIGRNCRNWDGSSTWSGKVRHLAVGDLWVQHHVRSGKIRVAKMSGLENPSDAQTKFLGPGPLLRHTKTSNWVPVVDDDKSR